MRRGKCDQCRTPFTKYDVPKYVRVGSRTIKIDKKCHDAMGAPTSLPNVLRSNDITVRTNLPKNNRLPDVITNVVNNYITNQGLKKTFTRFNQR